MRKRQRTVTTLLEACVEATGGDLRSVPKATRVCEFILEWAMATEALGREPSVREFGKWWKQSEKEQRTAWLRLKEFRQLFPDEDTPRGFSARMIEAEAGQKVELSALTRIAV